MKLQLTLKSLVELFTKMGETYFKNTYRGVEDYENVGAEWLTKLSNKI